MSSTVVYAAEALCLAGQVHVLGYQNKVQNGVNLRARLAGWLGGHGGNAMILPFPALPGSMTKENVIETKAFPWVLQDIAAAAVRPRFRDAYMILPTRSAPTAPRVQIFTTGIYTVVLAQDANDIPPVLDQVPAEKRPTLNPELFAAYAAWYPRWTIALCCFSNRKLALADPLLWWYQPLEPETLFLPALDCHTGAVPDLKAGVERDHVLAAGSHRMTNGQPVFYRDRIPDDVRSFLPHVVVGDRCQGLCPNGDYFCPTEEVRAGTFQPLLRPPPGVAA